MNYPWGHSKRYNAYPEYFKKRFGERIQKIAIDAGFTCPNRDGSRGTGGCTYCNNDAFNPSYCQPDKSITRQIDEGIEFHLNRYRRAKKYLAYFQPYSNTYASLEHLKKIFTEALNHQSIAGLVIGTRPDCIDDQKLDYFYNLSKKYHITIEYGIESCYNKTLARINRQHTFETSVEAVEKTASLGIMTGAHIIFGLPGESVKEMLEEARILSKLPVHSLKFHQLQIVKDTLMADEWIANPMDFELFTLDGYLDFIVRFIERLSPSIVIERFSGEVPPRFLLAPDWGLVRNDQINQLIENRLIQLNTWQGKKFISML